MRIKNITIQNFRNIAFAELPLRGARQFCVGTNAQGKTNLLEAVAFISALRSFRTSDDRALIAYGQPQASIACLVEHEKFGETRVLVHLRPGGKEVFCDGERISKLGDFLGRFSTVVFSSHDLLLVRGAPSGRRRWLDLILAQTDPVYLKSLQEYHRALADRNQLLKRGASPSLESELAAFEQPLARAAAELVTRRAAGLRVLGEYLSDAFARIDTENADASAQQPGARLEYAPDVPPENASGAEGWTGIFARNRQRDIIMRTTLAGPHRDDCDLNINARAAREYASEGQQRSLAICLRLAEAEYLRASTGVQPVLFADDILGELDPMRRRRFWASIGKDQPGETIQKTTANATQPAADTSRQIIATGTTLPDATLGEWQLFEVREGKFIFQP